MLVLEGITPWQKERNKQRRINGCGDTTDMNAWGFFQDEDGRVFSETIWNYMDLDYYTGPLEGRLRLLNALSSYMKGKIHLSLLLTAYRKVILDEFSKDVMLTSWYTNESMALAGLNQE